jgi:hypothetical protein
MKGGDKIADEKSAQSDVDWALVLSLYGAVIS